MLKLKLENDLNQCDRRKYFILMVGNRISLTEKESLCLQPIDGFQIQEVTCRGFELLPEFIITEKKYLSLSDL